SPESARGGVTCAPWNSPLSAHEAAVDWGSCRAPSRTENMMKRALFLVAASALAVTAAMAATGGKTMYGTWGVDLAARDLSVKPGDDFFMHVNGNWYKTAVIPPDRASTGSFQDLRILSEKRMQEIAASLDAKPRNQLSVEERKLRDFYDAFMDQQQIDARGL